MNAKQPFDNVNESNELVTRGIEQMYEAKYLDAISTFDKAIELNAKSLSAYQYRAICKYQLLMSTDDNISGKKEVEAMQNVISDLEHALSIAENIHEFFSEIMIRRQDKQL